MYRNGMDFIKNQVKLEQVKRLRSTREEIGWLARFMMLARSFDRRGVTPIFTPVPTIKIQYGPYRTRRVA